MISEFMTEAGVSEVDTFPLKTVLHMDKSEDLIPYIRKEQLQGKAIVYDWKWSRIRNYTQKEDIERLVKNFESRSEEYAAIARAIKEKNNL